MYSNGMAVFIIKLMLLKHCKKVITIVIWLLAKKYFYSHGIHRSREQCEASFSWNYKLQVTSRSEFIKCAPNVR